MSAESLQQSLESYEAQLKQIEDALSIASEDQKGELEQIRRDLKEIIDLTKASILPSNDEPQPELIGDTLEDQLQKLEGLKCQVPFNYAWGGVGYHNAIILAADVTDEGKIAAEVVFMHPTSKEMQPCPYFLEGKCKYSEEKCHYSHGYSVTLDSIRDYEEPDYTIITEGSPVLAKYKDDLWYRGRVEEHKEELKFNVKFDHCDDVLNLDLHSVYPVDDESDTDDSDEDDQFAPRDLEDRGAEMHEHVVLVNHTFGEWEKYTRGIGSKLMEKMGYVYGSGLGREGEGRIEPVKAVVFPPGRSLDWCVELKEKAGNENMLTVERKLERQKKKEEHRQHQMASVAQKHCSVFDFINSKLVDKIEKPDGGPSTSHSRQKMADLKGLSGRKLNVESFEIGESIRRVEREMADLKRSLQRHSTRGDSTTASQIQLRLDSKQKELDRLKASEKSLADEQKQRKSSTKLTIF